jgi:hypothetical protein
MSAFTARLNQYREKTQVSAVVPQTAVAPIVPVTPVVSSSVAAAVEKIRQTGAVAQLTTTPSPALAIMSSFKSSLRLTADEAVKPTPLPVVKPMWNKAISAVAAASQFSSSSSATVGSSGASSSRSLDAVRPSLTIETTNSGNNSPVDTSDVVIPGVTEPLKWQTSGDEILVERQKYLARQARRVIGGDLTQQTERPTARPLTPTISTPTNSSSSSAVRVDKPLTQLFALGGGVGNSALDRMKAKTVASKGVFAPPKQKSSSSGGENVSPRGSAPSSGTSPRGGYTEVAVVTSSSNSNNGKLNSRGKRVSWQDMETNGGLCKKYDAPVYPPGGGEE